MAYTKPTDTNVLLHKLETVFPDFQYSTYQHIKTGYDHDILIIDPYVYRFPKTQFYINQLASEAILTAYLSKETSITLPIYDYIAKDASFARHKYIKGAEVTKDTFRRLNQVKLAEITSSLATFLTRLHIIPNSKFDDFGFMVNQYDTPLGKVPNFVPTHSDLDINNMIWDEGQGLGIIDFGDRSLFDPAFDFGIFNMFGKTFINRVYEQYKGPKDANFLHRAELYYQRYLSSKLN